MTDTKLKPVIKYDDNLKRTCAYSVDENGNRQGACEYRNENGQLTDKSFFKDGKLDGPYEKYLDNGQLRIKGFFKNGNYDGPFETYDENGQFLDIHVYKMGNELCGEEEAKEYLQEWTKKQNSEEACKGLNARLAQLDSETQLRQSIRAEVSKLRENHSDKKDGCVAKKKNLLQKLFRGGR